VCVRERERERERERKKKRGSKQARMRVTAMRHQANVRADARERDKVEDK